jgi:hypothetical protein
MASNHVHFHISCLCGEGCEINFITSPFSCADYYVLEKLKLCYQFLSLFYVFLVLLGWAVGWSQSKSHELVLSLVVVVVSALYLLFFYLRKGWKE